MVVGIVTIVEDTASASNVIAVDSERGMATPGPTTHLIVITLGIDEVTDTTSRITLSVGEVTTAEGLDDIEEDKMTFMMLGTYSVGHLFLKAFI